MYNAAENRDLQLHKRGDSFDFIRKDKLRPVQRERQIIHDEELNRARKGIDSVLGSTDLASEIDKIDPNSTSGHLDVHGSYG